MKDEEFDYLKESARTASDKYLGHLVSMEELSAACQAFIDATAQLDRIKKLLFYGEKPEKGLVSTVEPQFQVTATVGLDLVRQSLQPGMPLAEDDQRHEAADIIHGIIGTATEAGELIEQLNKVLFEGAYLDLVNLKEEVFDGQWYHAMLCRVLGITFEEGQANNIVKLRERYPAAFNSDDAHSRDLAAERSILEGQAAE